MNDEKIVQYIQFLQREIKKVESIEDLNRLIGVIRFIGLPNRGSFKLLKEIKRLNGSIDNKRIDINEK